MLAAGIQQLWTAGYLRQLEKELVYADLCTREYEGVIRQGGDTVKLKTVGPITVRNYTKNEDIGDPDVPVDAGLSLVVDQAKEFNFAVDDQDLTQGDPTIMTASVEEASYAMRDAVDTYIGAMMHAAVASQNWIGSEASPKTDLGTAGKAYTYLNQLRRILNVANVPKAGRWVVVPPWYTEQLLEDSKVVGYGTSFNMDNLQNGEVGRIAGFRLRESNNVPSTTATTGFKIIAGYPRATGFVNQLTKIEMYRPEKRFAEAVKGLMLYGGKVIRSTGLAVLCANQP